MTNEPASNVSGLTDEQLEAVVKLLQKEPSEFEKAFHRETIYWNTWRA